MEARPGFLFFRGVAPVAILLSTLSGPLPLPAAQGGPDTFGYTWKDSAEGVPVENIPFDATPSRGLPSLNEWLSPPDQEIGFDFYFYDRWYRTVQISDNGWASFVTQADSYALNSSMPANREPEAFVAPLWDDLTMIQIEWGPILGGEGLKILWNGYQPTDIGPMNVRFCVYLFRDGRIRFTYFGAQETASVAVGIEDETESLGTTLLYDGTPFGDFSLGSNYAVEFYSPGQLTCDDVLPISCGDSIASGPPALRPAINGLKYCNADGYTAAERVFALDLDRPLDLEASISGFGARQLDLFLLGSCNQDDCLAGGADTLNFAAIHAGTYYLVVDGLDPADEGPFNISVTCTDPYLPIGCGEALAGTTRGQGSRKDAHACAPAGFDYGGGDSTYFLCLPDAMTLRFRLETTADLDLVVYRENLDPSSCAGWGDSAVTFFGAEAGCYYISVDGPPGAGGDFTIEAGCGAPWDCGSAIPIACGEKVSGNTLLEGRTQVHHYSCSGETFDGPEVLLSLSNPGDQNVSLVLDSSDPDMDLLLIESGRCDEGFCLQAADEILGVMDLPTGNYVLLVDGRNNAGGPFSVAAFCGRTVTPPSIEATLSAGTGLPEHKTVFLTPDIRRSDIMFAVDLTESMVGELENLKANSKEIVTRLAPLVNDLRFGLISFEDYPGAYSGPENCDRNAIYGTDTDEPYRLELPLTDNLLAFEAAVDSLLLGNGSDSPESYSRVLWESTADPFIGWRLGSLRLLVSFGDDVPHDCDVGACLGTGGQNWGKDPGRDGVVGTADDLAILDVLDEMAAGHITLVHFDSSDGAVFLPLWSCFAGITGGLAQGLSPDGSVPPDVDLADLVFDTLMAQARHCDALTMAPCPGFEEWLFSISPTEITNVLLPTRAEFDLVIGPPPGTPSGDHTFTMDVLCDGSVVAQQQVTIHVGDCSLVAVAPEDTRACEGTPITLDGSASRVTGCNGEVRYQWSRDGSVIRPWDADPTASDTVPPGSSTYTLEVACFGDPNCAASSSASFHLTPLQDLIPPPLGAALRVAKSIPRDVRLSWQDLIPAELAHSYQVIVLDNDVVSPPTPSQMDGANVISEATPQVEFLLHEGALLSPCPAAGMSPCKLLFYNVRATSPCSATPGPTCDGFPAQVPCP